MPLSLVSYQTPGLPNLSCLSPAAWLGSSGLREPKGREAISLIGRWGTQRTKKWRALLSGTETLGLIFSDPFDPAALGRWHTYPTEGFSSLFHLSPELCVPRATQTTLDSRKAPLHGKLKSDSVGFCSLVLARLTVIMLSWPIFSPHIILFLQASTARVFCLLWVIMVVRPSLLSFLGDFLQVRPVLRMVK